MREKLLLAVRSGEAGALFPPVAQDGPDGTIRLDRILSGDADAAALDQLLDDHLIDVLIELDEWCRRARSRFGAVVEAGILNPFNADLFGPLVTETFQSRQPGRDLVRRELAALELFLERLEQDSRSRWFAEPEYAPPVVGLRSHSAETHNGRRRVLRLELSGGARLAYKPRPANGEELFLAGPSSVFGTVNDLPPAAGTIRLPLLRCLAGDGNYSWQEWIEPPAEWSVLRRHGDHRLTGTRLGPGQAGPFWHRTGALTAACFAFGITDLGEGNLVTGPGPDGPMYYPIDLEIFLADIRRLPETGLVADPDGRGHHHCGLERTPRWCAVDGPATSFAETATGLRLQRVDQPPARTETRTVVVDADGQAGYGHHLLSVLRGMFDAWTTLCRHRDTIGELLARPARTRVLLRPTTDYAGALDDHVLAGAALEAKDAAPFSATELSQLTRGDVPYFYRSTDGGPSLSWDPDEERAVPVPAIPPDLPPSETVRRCERLTLSGLGAALRDAVEYILDDLADRYLVDEVLGVRVAVEDADAGQVSFDWTQTGRRITYSWEQSKVRLRIHSLDALAMIRERLLRLDTVDSSLRHRWTASEFTGTEDERRLRELTSSGANWLKQVIAEYGWPGRILVGDDAAAAASRLVQHLEDQIPFQRECLEHLSAAAATGDVPRREVAYLTDTIRLLEGREQVYGTKFRKQDGRLVPFPIEDAELVDQRRAEMGLASLSQYATHLHETFLGAGR